MGRTMTPKPMRFIPTHFNGNGYPKIAYETKEEAEEAAVEQQKNFGSKRRPYRAYKCEDFCGKWHIGKIPPKGKRNK